LTNDLRFRTRPGLQKMIQLHVRERIEGNEREEFRKWVELLSTLETQPTNGRARKGNATTVTLSCDTPVTSLSHVPRLGKPSHFYSPGCLRARFRQCLALSSKGFENFVDWCEWRSVSPSFSLDQKHNITSREIHPLADPCRKEAHQGCRRNHQRSRRVLPIPRRRNLLGHRMVSRSGPSI